MKNKRRRKSGGKDIFSQIMGAKGKVEKVLGEFKKGTLRSGSKSGPKVKDKKQAVAIAMSEQRKADKKPPDFGPGGDPSPAGYNPSAIFRKQHTARKKRLEKAKL